MKNERRGICYLCGKEGIMTDDHVPPRCLAPKANDSLFYKLLACETCNKALTVQESRFRDYVVAYAKDGVPEAEGAFEGMMRNFARGKEGRGGLRCHLDFCVKTPGKQAGRNMRDAWPVQRI